MDERKGIQVHLLCLSTEYHSKLNPKSKKKSKQIDRISKKKEGKIKKCLALHVSKKEGLLHRNNYSKIDPVCTS